MKKNFCTMVGILCVVFALALGCGNGTTNGSGGGINPNYYGTYTGSLVNGTNITSNGAVLSSGTITGGAPTSGAQIIITGVTMGPNNQIKYNKASIGAWAYVYSDSVKIGVAIDYSYGGTNSKQLVFGKSMVGFAQVTWSSTFDGFSSLNTEDMATTYTGTLTKE